MTNTKPKTWESCGAVPEPCLLCGGCFPNFGTIGRVIVCEACFQHFILRRELAFLVDLIAWMLLALPLMAFFMVLNPGLSTFGRVVLAQVLVLMFAFKDAEFSIGKFIFDLQVVDALTRKPAGLIASFKRNFLLCILPLMPAVILVMAVSVRNGMRLGDNWAGTLVIWRRYADRLLDSGSTTRCRTCGYDLTGNRSGVCPECGVLMPERDREAVAGRLAGEAKS